MELHQVRYVIAVVDHDGFTRAATALGVTQPSLSQGVRALEAELGVELFERLGRKVRLTAAGEAFAGPARQLLRAAAMARNAVAGVGDLVTGTLDLVALPTLAIDPLATLVAAFRAAYPGIVIRVAEPEDGTAVAALVRTGRAEIGLTDLPLRGDALVTEPLATQDLLAVCPPGTALEPTGASIADIARGPLVTTPPGTSTRRLLDRAFANAGLRPMIAVELSQRDAIVPLVLAGAGSSLLPRPLAQDAAARGAAIATLNPPISRALGIVRRDTMLSPAARAFLDLAKSAMEPASSLGDNRGPSGRSMRSMPARRHHE